MEMQEVTNGPALDPLREARRVGAGRPHADQRAAAQRLRERGFSYRRIAEVLRIRYDTVSRWLYGDAPAAAPPVAAPLPPVARSAPPVAAPPRAAALEQRVAALEATLARLQAEAAAREERLVQELHGLRQVLQALDRPGSIPGRILPWPRAQERA